jgi:hypothetical protein
MHAPNFDRGNDRPGGLPARVVSDRDDLALQDGRGGDLQ